MSSNSSATRPERVPAPPVILVLRSEDASLALPTPPIEKLSGDVLHAKSLETAEALVAQHQPGVIVTPLSVNGKSVLQFIKSTLKDDITRSIVVISKSDQINDAAEAMRLGAMECLFRPFSDTRFEKILETALARYAENRNRMTHQQDPAAFQPAFEGARSLGMTLERVPTLDAVTAHKRHGLILSDLSVQPILDALGNVAESNAPVMIQGATGTGKEVLARALHAESDRRGGPFVMLDCATLSAETLHTELFGTGANAPNAVPDHRKGLAIAANEGTLFLDGICEVSLDVQKKLVRFLETGEFRHEADATHQKLDVRIISTCRADPMAKIAAGTLREDLYYRLSVVSIQLPPLKMRGDDVMRIAQEKLTQMAQAENRMFVGFAPDATALLRSYSWPGNIRQLINTIWSITLQYDGILVTPDMLPAAIQDQSPSQVQMGSDAERRPETIGPDLIGRPLADIERVIIEETIRRENGSVPRAADVLGVSPSTIYRKREAWKDRD